MCRCEYIFCTHGCEGFGKTTGDVPIQASVGSTGALSHVAQNGNSFLLFIFSLLRKFSWFLSYKILAKTGELAGGYPKDPERSASFSAW